MAKKVANFKASLNKAYMPTQATQATQATPTTTKQTTKQTKDTPTKATTSKSKKPKQVDLEELIEPTKPQETKTIKEKTTSPNKAYKLQNAKEFKESKAKQEPKAKQAKQKEQPKAKQAKAKTAKPEAPKESKEKAKEAPKQETKGKASPSQPKPAKVKAKGVVKVLKEAEEKDLPAKTRTAKETTPKKNTKTPRDVPFDSLPQEIQFRVLLDPVAKGRGRIDSRSLRVYTPKETVAFEKAFHKEAKAQIAKASSTPIYPAGVALRVDVDFVFSRPKELQRDRYPKGLLRHTSKPDKDNLEKAVMDALNGLLFEDDSQVADGRTRKFYAEHGREGRIHVRVRPVPFAVDGTVLCDNVNVDLWDNESENLP